MQPERWRQIEQLFHAALERAPDERAAWLMEACADDEELRREIESLLAEHARGGNVLERGAADLAADWANAATQTTRQQTLGHFRILSLLGKGGMGEVHLAEDLKLHRKVALKLLPSEFTEQAARLRRFEQEARAASALNHPNILTIYEIGEAGPTHFMATEYVEGQTLRALLRQGALPLATVLDIGIQVASALSAAHGAGILHRDIKPENLMRRPDGLVKVLDFGLAKLTRPPRDATATTTDTALSTPGMVMGTLAYMSPEQAQGLDVDARTDVFSLGAVLYEMLAGQRAFHGDSQMAVLRAVIEEEPAPLPASVPADFANVVLRCLRKEPARRFQTAADLQAAVEDLRAESAARRQPRAFARHNFSRLWLALAVLALLAASLVGYAWRWRGARTGTAPEIKSLAVLPLENLSGDAAQEYFADGMTEAIIGNLAKIRALRVVSRPSVMRFKGSRKPLSEIARELQVEAVIVGSVQRASGRLKVTAQLIHAGTDAHLWADEYERDLSDTLKLQGEIARAVATEIRIQVTTEERARLSAARSINPQAHEAYLLGRVHFNKNNEQDWQRAISYFERATQLDPDYAAAYAGLSDVWLQRGVFAVKSFKEIEPQARAAALQALKLNEQLPEAHVALGNLKLYNDWDWTGAEAAFKRALELDPGGLDAHRSYGHLLMALGRHTEAVREGRIAERLDPLSAETQTALGRFLYRARRYEEALPHLQLAVEREPRSIGANVRLGDNYLQLRRYAEALAVFEKGRELTRDERGFQTHIAHVYALTGRQREARQMISGGKSEPILAAAVCTALGDKDEAFRILAQAIEERNSFLMPLKEDPPFESLHADPRWKELLRRMNFPPE